MLNISSYNSSEAAGEVIPPIAIISATIYCVIFLVGTLGNGLVIYVTGCRMKKTVNSVWFLNLALADFLFTGFLIFMIISAAQNYTWNFGNLMCKVCTFMSTVNMFASVFLLMAISLDRCLSIWVVVWAQNKRSVRKAQIITAVIWMTAVVCSSPYATFRGTTQYHSKIKCGYRPGTPHNILKKFRFVVGFAIPFLVICISYVAIAVRAKRLHKTNNRRSQRIICAIILAFFICWLPFHVVQLVKPTGQIVNIVGPLSLCLGFINSCLNPILYVFMCDEFQKKLKQSIFSVLETALADDHLSFMSSRSLSSHLSRISRRSDSAAPSERKGTATSLNFSECKVVMNHERETSSTE
ncbi:chemokine-like receptor 1 [Echeneis naucrates]|uniref:Chemokine-like receptor 1 n=1 Tax=Echeneis naucrates TaxID=173247 RepID=A0A665W4W0_ECHNA|nr:chemokine-like receptor 1 [Echeneis naucrates]